MLSPLYSYQGDQPAELISSGLLLLVACPPNQQETSQLLSRSHSGVEFNPNGNAVFLIQLVAGSALNSCTCEASRSQLIISDCELNRGVTVTGILTHWKWCSSYTEAAYLWVSSACWELASWDGFTNTPLAALALKLSLPCISYIIHAPVVPAMSEISRVCGHCVISIQLNWYYYCNTGAKVALVVYKQ